MSRVPTLRQQLFGDINKQLNKHRARINGDVRARCFEILEKKKEQNQGGK